LDSQNFIRELSGLFKLQELLTGVLHTFTAIEPRVSTLEGKRGSRSTTMRTKER
jgi:hypothetical protein